MWFGYRFSKVNVSFFLGRIVFKDERRMKEKKIFYILKVIRFNWNVFFF